jgi:hypothetical protein
LLFFSTTFFPNSEKRVSKEGKEMVERNAKDRTEGRHEKGGK